MMTLKQILIQIADAIRGLNGKTEKISPQEFENELLNISEPTLAASMVDNIGYGKNVFETVTIYGGCTEVQSGSFAGCYITNLNFEDGVKIIRSNSFSKNTKLTNIVLPKTIETIEVNAFQSCTSLGGIIVHEENATYSSCGSNIIFEKGTSTLVQGCKNSTIPEDTKIIGNYAFYDVNITEIRIPDKVTTIGEYAFYNTPITSLDLGSVKTINNIAFSKIRITTLTLPDSVISVSVSAFSGCTSLEEITMSKNITNTAGYCFSGCTLLNNVYFPKGSALTTLAQGIFSNCSSLEELVIPGSEDTEGNTQFRTIGNEVFNGCSNFKRLDLSQLNVIPTLGTNAFKGCHSDLKIIIPDDKYNDWISRTNWSDYKDNIIKASEYTES